MKKLKDNVLLYDCECPMCRVYSSGFILTGMLDKNGRMNYATMDESVRQCIDVDRARNEIALVNTKDQTVTYGIHSLFAIISHSFPVFKGLFAFKPFEKIMKRVYSFVSFNRRVIICGNDPGNPLACNPDFSLKYRIAYLVFSALVSAFVLKNFSPLLGEYWPIPKGWMAELFLVSGQLAFQALALFSFSKKVSVQTTLDYLANVMTVSLLGCLLLLPALLLSLIVHLSVYVCVLWFSVTVACMFFEHKRRVRVYDLPAYLSYTWVLYRFLISTICILFFS